MCLFCPAPSENNSASYPRRQLKNGRCIMVIRWCTAGQRIPHSPTYCAGTAREECPYICDDGYHVAGRHVCDADRRFRGGSCLAATCPVPALTPGQVITAGCATAEGPGSTLYSAVSARWPESQLYHPGANGSVPHGRDDELQLPAGGALGSATCELGCIDGYAPDNSTIGRCQPVPGSSNASFVNHGVTCTKAMCPAAPVLLHTRYEAGCESDGSVLLDTCILGCKWYDVKAATVGNCSVDAGQPTASYQGQSTGCVAAVSSEFELTWTESTIGDGIAQATWYADRPGRREGHRVWKAVMKASNDTVIYLFGGQGRALGGAFGLLQDLYIWDESQQHWLLQGGSRAADVAAVFDGDGAWPGARLDCAAWGGPGGASFVFGGYGKADWPGYLSDLWKYNESGWTFVGGPRSSNAFGEYPPIGQGSATSWPGGRRGMTVWQLELSTAYLFGGFGECAATAAVLSVPFAAFPRC